MSGRPQEVREDAGMLTPTIRSWQLRVLLALAAGGTVAAVGFWTSPHPFFVSLFAASAVYTVARPHSHGATAVIGAAVYLVVTTDPGLSLWTMAAVLGVHATHVLAALAAVVPIDAAVERSALSPSLRRFAAVQAASQVLVILALVISP